MRCILRVQDAAPAHLTCDAQLSRRVAAGQISAMGAGVRVLPISARSSSRERRTSRVGAFTDLCVGNVLSWARRRWRIPSTWRRMPRELWVCRRGASIRRTGGADPVRCAPQRDFRLRATVVAIK